MAIDASFYTRPEKVKERTSAGGIVVRRDVATGTILVALAREVGLPSYILPKGGVETGESLEDAARREIQEEAGFTRLTRLAALGTRARLSYDKRKWITTHYFLFATDEETATPTDTRHEYIAEWFPVDNLPQMFWPEQRELIESARPSFCALLKEHAL